MSRRGHTQWWPAGRLPACLLLPPVPLPPLPLPLPLLAAHSWPGGLVCSPCLACCPLPLWLQPSPRSTMFLMGPAKQLSRMFDSTRRWSTVVYLSALLCTLISAIVLHSIILSVLFIVIQFGAFLYYALRCAVVGCSEPRRARGRRRRQGRRVWSCTGALLAQRGLAWPAFGRCCGRSHAWHPPLAPPPCAAATSPEARPLRGASCLGVPVPTPQGEGAAAAPLVSCSGRRAGCPHHRPALTRDRLLPDCECDRQTCVHQGRARDGEGRPTDGGWHRKSYSKRSHKTEWPRDLWSSRKQEEARKTQGIHIYALGRLQVARRRA